MKISYNWLKHYLDFDRSPEEVAETITTLGLEVEEVVSLGIAPNDKLVVGEVLEINPHPNADKLSVCKVNVGEGEPSQIVCGAKNFKVGDRVPVALVGCELADGDKTFEIKATKLRGVESCGMMCATDEIGLGGTHDGLMILNDLNPTVGAKMHELVKGDTVFEIGVLPNRPDALSHLGVARDLAAKWGLEVKLPKVPAVELKQPASFNSITIENLDDCSHYRGAVIKGVKIAPSPMWLQDFIKSVGLRPINNIVDITNFIVLGLGQPLHAFDLSKIEGGQINVRRATDGEKIVTLDEKQRSLAPSMLVIADAAKPLVVAGIMGGEDSGVTDQTTDILLEAAHFNPTLIRKTSRKLALSSDSSMRFERGIDPRGVQFAFEQAAAMIVELAGGTIEGAIVEGGQMPTPTLLETSRDFIVERLGFNLDCEQIEKPLTAFGFTLAPTSEDSWTIRVPSYRLDIERPVDFVEEVLRYYGVERIPSAKVRAIANEQSHDRIYEVRESMAERLAAMGFSECFHYSMRAPEEIEKLAGENAAAHKLAYPLSADASCMRYSLLPGLLDAVALNASRGNPAAPLFEVGHIYRADSPTSLREYLAISFVKVIEPAAESWRGPARASDFFAAKAVLENLFVGAGFKMPGVWSNPTDALWQSTHSGTAGELSKHRYNLSAGIVSLELTKAAGFDGVVLGGEILFGLNAFEKASKPSRYKPFSVFPASRRDVAVIASLQKPVGEVTADLQKIALKATGKDFELESLQLFDRYIGKGVAEGHQSLAYALNFRSMGRTLTDEEVSASFEKILEGVKATGYSVRG